MSFAHAYCCLLGGFSQRFYEGGALIPTQSSTTSSPPSAAMYPTRILSVGPLSLGAARNANITLLGGYVAGPPGLLALGYVAPVSPGSMLAPRIASVSSRHALYLTRATPSSHAVSSPAPGLPVYSPGSHLCPG